METFRVRHSEPGQERILLLALSCGPGSNSLLHVLSQHLEMQQRKTGRTGYKLHVLHVRDDAESIATDESDKALEKVKSRFPEHSYSTSPLSDVCLDTELPLSVNVADKAGDELLPHEKLKLLLGSLGSATSRTDMKQLLKRKLIVTFAKQNGCEAILWGDNTTTLAERVLAETAKGRGFSLPWVVTDGESPHNIPFYYPARDILGKEITVFASLVDPPLHDLIVTPEGEPAVSIKNTTIDDLMRQYFESVERDYPSIVTNVVKTTGKLEALPLSSVETLCELCDMPLDGQAPERSRLCYGCIRTMPTSPG